MEGTVLSGRFPLYRHFVPHRTSSRTGDKVGCGTLLRIGDEVTANQSGRLVCMSGLWPQGHCAAAAALFIFGLVHFRLGENERGSFALCGARPGSTWTGQPARLDRAGPQARTRFRLRPGDPTLSPVRDEVKLRESSAETPVIRLKACWTVFGNHDTIKRENHRTKRMISKT